MFAINHQWRKKWRIFAKMLVCAQILAPGVSNRRRMFELENQFLLMHFTSNLNTSLAEDSKTKMGSSLPSSSFHP